MNVRELTFRGEEKSALYACGKCGLCYSPKNYAWGADRAHEAARESAERCCVPPTCSVCGVEVSRPWAMCAEHREQAKLKRAVPIPASAWADPVHRDDMGGEWGEGDSSSVHDLLDWWEFEKLPEDAETCADAPEPPAYCWPCVPTDFSLDADRLLESALEEFREDAMDEIVDADALCEFLKAWNEKQTLKTWYPDHTRVVVLDEARFQAILDGR